MMHNGFIIININSCDILSMYGIKCIIYRNISVKKSYIPCISVTNNAGIIMA